MKASLGRRTVASALAVSAGAFALTAPSAPAGAAVAPVSPALNFNDCPTLAQLPAGSDPIFWLCSVVVITGGRMKLGTIDQQITTPIKLTYANGFDPATLEEKFVFTALKAEPIKVNGGIFGIPGTDFLPILEVRALPQSAADPVIAPPDDWTVAFRMKLKVQVINPLLGETCFIGSAATPLTLNLTFMTTNPPLPNVPITGSGPVPHPDDPNVLNSTLVDNAFAVPKAAGCGPWGLLNPVADLRAGLPAKAGVNTVIFDNQVKFRSYADPTLTGAMSSLKGLTPQEATAALKKKAQAN